MSVAAIVGIIGGVLGILGVVIGALWRVASVGRDIGVMMARFEDHLGRMDGRVAKLESAEEGRVKSQIEKQAARIRELHQELGRARFVRDASSLPPNGVDDDEWVPTR